MKKSTSFLVFFILIVFSFQQIKATIITVDNSQPRIGQYSSIQEAHDAANSGDTIYVYPSITPYLPFNFTKKIYFIGAGFKSSNIGLKTTIIKGTVKFDVGSDGSVLTGFGDSFSIIIDADQITLSKSRIKQITIIQGHFGTSIIQNHFEDNVYPGALIEVNSYNEVYISNNILINWAQGSFCEGKILSANGTFITINLFNNIFDTYGSHPCENREYQYPTWAISSGENDLVAINNIIIGYIHGLKTGYYYNLHSLNQLDPLSGNKACLDHREIFIDMENGDYRLKSGSPAIGAGINGVDLGAYGGDIPYDDNGYPAIPSIYYLDVPFTGSQKQGINVTIKAKSNQ